ncbi:unnamed protein product [Camellia sinensis]
MVFSSIPAYLDPSNCSNKILKLELALEMETLIFHNLRCHHHHARVMVWAQSGLVRWLTRPEWLTYPCQKLPRNARDLNQQTQGFATSTTTASLSLGTFPRLVGGTGRERSKGSNNLKSPVSGGGGDGQTSSGSTSAISSSTSVGTASLLGLTPQITPLRFMAAPLSQLTDHHHHHYGEIGLNYSGISAPLLVTSDMNMNFHLGSSSLGLGGGGGGGSGTEHWRLQQPTQISPMASLDFLGALYPFQGGVEPSGYGGEGSLVRSKPPGLVFTTHQLGSVKMEDNQVQELNLSRQFLGISRKSHLPLGIPYDEVLYLSCDPQSEA